MTNAVEVAVHGSLWLRVHGPEDAATDLEIGPAGSAELEVTRTAGVGGWV